MCSWGWANIMIRKTLSPTGNLLAYEALEGTSPQVMFLTGFKSDMNGTKAMYLRDHCAARGIGFLRFDYSGHGESSGQFDACTISTWLADSLHMLDHHTRGRVVLVGSSMGGWLALLLARARPERVAALIGIAAAPDFTEELIWKAASAEQKQQLAQQGFFEVPNCYGGVPYKITHALIEDGRKHLLLHAPLDITCPIHLLHGTNDEDVPLWVAQKIASLAPHATLTTIKDGNHRLSEAGDLALLSTILENSSLSA